MTYLIERNERFGTSVKIDLPRFARDLAKAMGGRSVTEGGHSGYYKFRLGDDEIGLYADHRKRRVTVSISAPDVDQDNRQYHSSLRSNERTEEATVNPEARTIERIAADVKKRVVDASQNILVMQRERIASRRQTRSKLSDTAERVSATGVDVSLDQDKLNGTFYLSGNNYLTGRFSASDVTIERIGSLSVEKFARIVAILNEA